jgi:uncharacterized membrane protein
MSLPGLIRHFRARPALVFGALVAIAAGSVASTEMSASHAVLVGWCSGVAVYLGLSIRIATRETPASIRRHAKTLDLGAGFISAVTTAAAVMSVSAIIIDMGHSKAIPGDLGLSIALAVGTLLLSWFFIQTAFAFHYAHMFYQDHECLVFPGTKEPDYWDFLYFSAVIGMTAQVSDVTTGTPGMRRLVMVHGIIAFFFNTAILALGVNFAASLAS